MSSSSVITTPAPAPAPGGESSAALAIAPVPRCSINVRPAVAADIPFIDSLQRMHSHMVGWMPRKQLQTYIEGGHVLVAEEVSPLPTGEGSGVSVGTQNQPPTNPPTNPHPSPLPKGVGVPLGYCIAKDQYMKRDDVGIIYQLNVLPLRQRNLIGASLIKATFERAAYGCKLFSCWCAQDIQANWFWESIGFVPLAFRTGSRAKQRIHIFWQRRVRAEGNTGGTPVPLTPYWFPSQTTGGAVAEDRIVLPIPPGTHWRDAKPLILPGGPGILTPAPEPKTPLTLPGGAPVRPRPQQPKFTRAQKAVIMRSESRHLGAPPLGKKAVISAGGIRYVDRTDYVPELDPLTEELAPLKKSRRTRPPKERRKHDPKYIAAARELRDRFLEQINSDPGPGSGPMLPGGGSQGKYDVSRQMESPASSALDPTRLLEQRRIRIGPSHPIPLPTNRPINHSASPATRTAPPPMTA